LAGDDDAWRAGYDAAFPTVRTYVYWRCAGLTALADDVLQETWMTAVRRIADFAPDRGTFANWVCGIAGNVARNTVRNHRRRVAKVEALHGDCSSPTQPDRLERSERTARALSELPEHYERALRDKYVQNLSVAEMAEARGDSNKAVESLLSRAREAFRDAYERMGDDG
jgi:RNA polymerase sigma-70 factor (ECF subfamily)